MDPLPPEGIPTDQTVEGGAQVRVTPTGFDKLTAIIPQVINDSLVDGFCIGEVSIYDVILSSAEVCDTNACTGGAKGCQVNINIDNIDLSVPDPGTLRIHVQFDLDALIHATAFIFGLGSAQCNFLLDAPDTSFDVDIGVGIDPVTGELVLITQDLSNFQLNASVTGCGLVGDLLNGIVNIVGDILDILTSELFDFLDPLILPIIDSIVQSFLPDPLGIEGIIDMSDLVGGISPGTNALLEARIVPGGYAYLERSGLSLGIITAFNADEDITTRTTDLDSEPALCVPPLAAPDFSAPPASLTKSIRDTFKLDGAGAFRGMPDPPDDIVIGVSETFLDLTGHHLVTSGTMCLGIGTEFVDQLNLGTVGILVPSLAELGSEDGSDPLLLVTRPQTPIDFAIGDGTDTSPALTISLRSFEVDFYAFIFERFVRGFTISLDLEIGVNLEFTTDAMGNPALMPILSGLETDNITIRVLNEEFLREDRANLEAVFPSIFDLALPLIADGLDAITLPDFGGFTLSDLKLSKVTTSEDDFLSISATLGVSAMMMQLAEKYPSVGEYLEKEFAPIEIPDRADGLAELARVTTPAPAVILAALKKEPGGALPEVVFDVETHNALGQELEWTWNIGGGMWRPFRSGNDQLVISDGAFAIQGRYDIWLKSRIKGDYRTLAEEAIVIPVVIDSVGPRIHAHRTTIDGEYLIVPASDLVTDKRNIAMAFGSVNDERPITPFSAAPIDLITAGNLAGQTGVLRVWARDELDNETDTAIDLGGVVNFHGQGSGGGCGCSVGDGNTATGSLLLLGFTAFLLGARRKRVRDIVRRAASSKRVRDIGRAFMFIAIVGAFSALPACSCGADSGGGVCELNEDCAATCDPAQIPLCFENECYCADDVPFGRNGQYSEMDIANNGAAWVSAYNSTHGDLMVARWPMSGRIPVEAWEYVDGVPDGPVVVPESNIRGGIFDAGEDVGRYTSIVVINDEPRVSYFDATNAALKYASKSGGTWSIHTVDSGSPVVDPELGFEITGQYTSITADVAGVPGIAYFVHIADGSGDPRTEVRYARANSANPTSSSDWTFFTVDMATVPPPANGDPFPIPPGVGLFINSARKADGNPVLVYYDRQNGDLKMAEFAAGVFMTPVILDGALGDVGWYPGITIDSGDNVHVSYVDASNDDLYYINTIDNTPELVDDGYRIVGTTVDGLPKPEFHFIGDDSSMTTTNAGPIVVYQDATSHELLLAKKNGNGVWEHQTIAGDEDPFTGGYGFYAAARYDGTDVVMSTWALDQSNSDSWVEIFRETIVIE